MRTKQRETRKNKGCDGLCFHSTSGCNFSAIGKKYELVLEIPHILVIGVYLSKIIRDNNMKVQ